MKITMKCMKSDEMKRDKNNPYEKIKIIKTEMKI